MKAWLALLISLPLTAMADQPPAHGLSGDIAADRLPTATERALEQQRRSPPATHSEISNGIYVESQRRLSDSFRQPIPESFGNQTRDEN